MFGNMDKLIYNVYEVYCSTLRRPIELTNIYTITLIDNMDTTGFTLSGNLLAPLLKRHRVI